MLPQLTSTGSDHMQPNQAPYLNTFDINQPTSNSSYENWVQTNNQFPENATTFNATIASLCDVQISAPSSSSQAAPSSQIQNQQPQRSQQHHPQHLQHQHQQSYQFSPMSDDLFQPEEIFQLDQPLKNQTNTTQFTGPSPPTTTLLDLGSGVIQHKQQNNKNVIACGIDGLYDETLSRSPTYNQSLHYDPAYCESGKYYNEHKSSHQQHSQNIITKDCYAESYYGIKESFSSQTSNNLTTTTNLNYLNNNNNNNNTHSNEYYGVNQQQTGSTYPQNHHHHHQQQQNHNSSIYNQYASYSSHHSNSNEFNSSYNNSHYHQYLAAGSMSTGDGIYSITNHN